MLILHAIIYHLHNKLYTIFPNWKYRYNPKENQGSFQIYFYWITFIKNHSFLTFEYGLCLQMFQLSAGLHYGIIHYYHIQIWILLHVWLKYWPIYAGLQKLYTWNHKNKIVSPTFLFVIYKSKKRDLLCYKTFN